MKCIKNKIIVLLIVVFAFGMASCSKFLDVESTSQLSGNNFWKTKDDYESYALGMYKRLRDATMINAPFFVYSGDLRNGFWIGTGTVSSGSYFDKSRVTALSTNAMSSFVTMSNTAASNITNWSSFYTIIAEANILAAKADEASSGILTDSEKKGYKAEAVFMRCLIYFLMSRIYGDVPYYTEAYFSDPIARSPMNTVLQNCINDLTPEIANLPWVVSDGNTFNIRANKGGAYALLMHINMWLAGMNSNSADVNSYYEATDSLGTILTDNNQGYYDLMPLTTIEDSKTLFYGNNKECLFVIPQNPNLGSSETFSANAEFANLVLNGTDMTPTNTNTKAKIYMDDKTGFDLLFPSGTSDRRLNLWLGGATSYASDGTTEMKKFYNIDQQNGGSIDSKIVFRLADAILLRAEALNDLGKVSEAVTLVNRVRTRAGASSLNYSSGSGESSKANSDLDEDIFLERGRELLGEGFYFYDLVRTKRILNSNYTTSPMSSDAFKAGAWTWPINSAALTQNPYIVLNTYWTN